MPSKLSLPRQGLWHVVWVKRVFELSEVELTEFHCICLSVVSAWTARSQSENLKIFRLHQSCPLSTLTRRAEQSFMICYPNVVIKSLCGNLGICLKYRANAYFQSQNSVCLISVVDRDRRWMRDAFFKSRFTVALLNSLADHATCHEKLCIHRLHQLSHAMDWRTVEWCCQVLRICLAVDTHAKTWRSSISHLCYEEVAGIEPTYTRECSNWGGAPLLFLTAFTFPSSEQSWVPVTCWVKRESCYCHKNYTYIDCIK